MADFGTDTSCTDSMHHGRMSTGVRLVAEACYRRLITERGSLRGGPDEANYGLDLTQLIGAPGGASRVAVWEGMIRGELRKDPRVQDVAVAITRSVDTARESWLVTIAGTTAAGPFALTLGVSSVTVDLLGLEA